MDYEKFQKCFLSVGAVMAATPGMAQYSPTPEYPGKMGKTVSESQIAYPQHNPVAAPGSPNVVWILLDDVGFGATSPFGGLIETPTFDYLAQNGLRFNNFHTTSISAPTRAALLTGRNHHSSHTGLFNITTEGAPGYDSYVPCENGNIAEVLQENGYSTFAVGKYNATNVADAGAAGPFNRWPTSRGFDHFFGYNPAAACDDQWHPFLYRDTQREPDDSLGLLAITRFTNEAIQYIADQKTAAPEKPFFLYFAPGTAHYPHQTTPEWADKFKGKFDMGWDEYSKKVLDNQIKMGIVPKGTKLPIRNKDMEEWENITDEERKIYARQMEVYAGFLAQADYEIGRIVDFIREIGQLDNTIIMLAIGDNGATSEGGKFGKIKPERWKKDIALRVEGMNLEKLGAADTYPFYNEAWGAACNTPFRYYKMFADYEGGTHNGLIAFYPKGIKEKGGIRTQYTHCIDVYPTTVELTGTKVPEVISGYKQNPVEGISFAPSVLSADNNVEESHTSQYYELLGTFAYYKDGWKVQFPNDKVAAQRQRNQEFDSIPHLYNLKEDFNESKDLAEKYPEKVAELIAEFEKDAWKYGVYPLFTNETDAQRVFKNDRSHIEIFIGPKGYAEYPYLIGMDGHSFSLSADIEATPSTNGVLFSINGNANSFSFYLKDGVPTYCFKRYFDLPNFPMALQKVKADRQVPEGKSNVKMDFNFNLQTYDCDIVLYINNEKVGEGSIGKGAVTSFMSILGPQLQIGRCYGVSFTDDYKSPNLFGGKIKRAYIDIKPFGM